MALSGLVLKKGGDIDLFSVIEDVKLAAERAGLQIRMAPDIKETWWAGPYTSANIATTFEDKEDAQQWLMYLYSDDIDYERFDRVVKGENLVQVINIEKIYGCERMLLDFLYEYLKLNPEDYFWDEFEWYYTYEDIKAIRQKEFDPRWCYKAPLRNNGA